MDLIHTAVLLKILPERQDDLAPFTGRQLENAFITAARIHRAASQVALRAAEVNFEKMLHEEQANEGYLAEIEKHWKRLGDISKNTISINTLASLCAHERPSTARRRLNALKCPYLGPMIPDACAAAFRIFEKRLKREIDSNKRHNCREKRKAELSVKKRGHSSEKKPPEMKPAKIKSLITPLWISATLQEIVSVTDFEYEVLVNSKNLTRLWRHTSKKR